MVVEVGFCFLVTLGHNLVGMPPITAPGVAPTATIPDEQVKSIVDQLLESARKLRDQLSKPLIPADGEIDLGELLRKNPVKLG